MHQVDLAGILLVNGGRDPRREKWIRFCLQRIYAGTDWPNFHIYVWNNNVDDADVVRFLEQQPSLTLVQADPAEKLAHPHAVPLQRLYETAREDGCRYIVTMDSDSHPLHADWLRHLIQALDENVVLSGVWRDELKEAIKPYVHPSCLCTTVRFIEENRLRLDDIASNAAGVVHDTMSHFTDAAERAGKATHRLLRSNKRNFHRLIGGIYGDAVYHHGAGSRRKVSFWDEPATLIQTWINEQLSQRSADLLLTRHEAFIAWLRGEGTRSPGLALAAARLQALNLAGRLLPIALRLLSRLKRAVKAVLRRHLAPAKARLLTQMVRPLELRDLSPVPAGWQAKGPDFVGIGAPKAGTSWWCALLFEHPQIYSHRYCDSSDFVDTKELCYFPHFGYRDMSPEQASTYRAMFAAPPDGISGEWSVLYLSYPHCLDHLREAAPESKIIVMLRNPVDRTLSHVNQLVNNRARNFGFTADEEHLFTTFSVYPEAVLNSLYAYGIQRLLSLYPREQILFLQYERCREQPAMEIARTYRFLGVDDTYLPGQLARQINRKDYSVARLSPSERKRLAEYLRADVEQTLRLLPELDRGLWLDFSA